MDVPNRAFKPLDINGLRLYRVEIKFFNNPKWNSTHLVIAKSPTEAARLIKEAYSDAEFIEEPFIKGYGVDVYQPIKWSK